MNVTIELAVERRSPNVIQHAAKVLEEHMTIAVMDIDSSNSKATITGNTTLSLAAFTALVYGDGTLREAIRKLRTNADPLELSSRPQNKPQSIYTDMDVYERCEDRTSGG